LDQNLSKRRSESRDAVSWLRNELADVHNNLTKSREKLGDLTAAHGVVSLEREFNHVASSFISAADNLVKAREARIKLQALLNQEDKGGPSILPQVANQEHLLKMKGYLAEVEAEYIKATTLYSSDNPRVVMMKMKVDDLRDRIRESERATVSASLAVAMKEEDLSRAQFDESRKKAMDLNAVGVQYAILQKEIETSQTTYQLLLQKTREMEVSAGVTGNNIGILLRPTKPARPERPKKLFNLLIGCVLGLIVGILAAVVRELTDKSIKSNNDLREHVNLPSLGTVPNIESLKPRKLMQLEKPLYELLANQEPQSPFYDVLKDIQTSIMISSDGGSNILGITSACPQEGKTFLAVAMATVMCADSKVLLVDCDLREPRIHKIFSKDGTKLGLSTLLTNKDINPQEVIIPSVLPNLDIMTCGPLPPNPAAVLGRGAQLINLFRILREEYPLVILDCPPILGFPDTRILTLYADEYVLVVKAGQYGPDVKKAVDLLSDSKARLLGGILNMTRLDLSDDRLKYGRYLKHYSRSQSTLEPRLTKY
jgi:capsular exopolysaccharide synthesis family protein